MEVKQLLLISRQIWGQSKLTMSQIIIRLGKVFGDLCRWERDSAKDQSMHTDIELKKELGNIIFSTIRWCDDLGYDPDDCINLAIEAQKKFPK